MAEGLAGDDDRVDPLQMRVNRLPTHLERKIAAPKSNFELLMADLRLLKRMTGTTLALMVAILVKLFVH